MRFVKGVPSLDTSSTSRVFAKSMEPLVVSVSRTAERNSRQWPMLCRRVRPSDMSALFRAGALALSYNHPIAAGSRRIDGTLSRTLQAILRWTVRPCHLPILVVAGGTTQRFRTICRGGLFVGPSMRRKSTPLRSRGGGNKNSRQRHISRADARLSPGSRARDFDTGRIQHRAARIASTEPNTSPPRRSKIRNVDLPVSRALPA
jgi:hypothetical protein